MGFLKKLIKGKHKAKTKEVANRKQPKEQQPQLPALVAKNNTNGGSPKPPTIPAPKLAPRPSSFKELAATDTAKQKYHSSYSSGASTPEVHSDDEEKIKITQNPKIMLHSTSQIGLDEMIDDRRNDGDLRQNIVHIEVPFGKPIEEVYDGVHSGPVLGSGISGLVRLVTHKATGLKYAVKVLDLGLVDNSEGLQQLREEIFIMCQLDHPNIVRLEEVYESQSEIYLVQELCLGGELFDRLDEQPDYHYTEAECARLVKQMLSAVRYLHSRGIIHRDLKLENFLFSSTSTDSELKMIDFGLSKHFRFGEIQHEAVGTPYTVAPEVIRGSYDERCDIWAIGVITFLLLSGDPPFGGCGGPEPLMTVRGNILRGSFQFEPEYIWANVSHTAREFIKEMLKTDPKDRPTAKTAQKHAWLVEWASRNRTGEDNVLNPNVVKALVNFKEFSDMRKLLCEVLSFTLLPSQIKELRHEFEKMDTEGSGEISLAALKQVLLTNAGAGSLGALTEEEVEDIFNAMRVRKTETRIHWHEFIAAGLSQCQVDDRNLRLAFDRLDSDHKGYITLDDIMDLMGSDAMQSEDAVRRMWGDSIKAVESKHAHITYDDFLLLMKGQTNETPSQELERNLEMDVANMEGTSLHVVPETETASHESSSPTIPDGKLLLEDALSISNHSGSKPLLKRGQSHSAPTTPTPKKSVMDLDFESPLSMDDDDGIAAAGPGIAGTSASLTPPMSPSRGAADYVTPGSYRPCMDILHNGKGMDLPQLPISASKLEKPRPYTRRRSRSFDTETERETTDEQLNAVAHVMRDMLLPETDHVHPYEDLEDVVKDDSKSALVVNRKLYRAHRQMRLSVLEASKRFEEQQAQHARDVILAQRERKEGREGTGIQGMIQAGLVMIHGHKKQVSSKAIRTLLEKNNEQQQELVEKANRRGGRGRRSRKKTISDMSGMMTSMGSDDLAVIAQQASLDNEELMEEPPPEDMGPPERTATAPSIPVSPGNEMDDLSEKGKMRAATVPGEFRKTYDPFGTRGKYGAATAWKQG